MARRSGVLLGAERPRIFTRPLRRLTPNTSLGYAAHEFAADVLGVPLLPWERWFLIHALELLPDGTPRFRTVLLLVARQNGKSTTLQVLALFVMYVLGVDLVIGTAQDLDTAEEVWQGAVEMAEGVPDLAAEIAKINRTNGKHALELASGSRWKVKAASRRGGRGLSGDLALLDELREHQKWDTWAAITKTMMARPQAQAYAASNAGDRNSVVLAYLRKMAHTALGDPDGFAGDTGVADDSRGDASLGIFEWSAAPGCDIWDRRGWAQANPSLGHTITERAIASAAATDPEDVFRTEVLCQWVDFLAASPDELNVMTWLGCEVPDAAPVGAVAFGVDVAPWQASASIVACGVTSDGTPVVEVVERRARAEWLPARLAELVRSHEVSAIGVDPQGPVGSMLTDLERAGVQVVPLDGKDSTRALTSLSAAVAGRQVVHRGQPELSAAVSGARRRQAGDGQRWSRSDSTVDISPLVAATAAHWLWLSRAGESITPDIYFV